MTSTFMLLFSLILSPTLREEWEIYSCFFSPCSLVAYKKRDKIHVHAVLYFAVEMHIKVTLRSMFFLVITLV